MFTSDEQILKLPDRLIADKKISGMAQFYEETGITRSLFSKVKNQDKYTQAYHFSPIQIETICIKYDINSNWIFAFSTDLYLEKPTNKVKSI